jgi:GAF domain-containing protein
MEANSTLDRTSAAAGTKPAVAADAALHPVKAAGQNNSNPIHQAGVSAALAAARAETSVRLAAGGVAAAGLHPAGLASDGLTQSVRFPEEDGGHSLAEMAQRDLDAALQLLADRAQYITGASGAAIAIRRDGRNDMLCRASTGMNAPELGALLSTEFGLSGESVRTRQALRCDDAERDKRVNREVCREMGIASVVVMPVVNDDEVLGVFELFSGKANAFGARDVSAVQRLSEMVETAVRLAQAAQNLPERLKMGAVCAPVVEEVEVDEIEVEVQEDQVLEAASGAKAPVRKEESIAAMEAPRPPKTSPEASSVTSPKASPEISPVISLETSTTISPETAAAISRQTSAVISPQTSTMTSPEGSPASLSTTLPKKALFWSAALNPVAEAGVAEDPDQSHVPPVLRSLRKCAACGFPVTAGRTLCVECEERKWRGQLKPAARPGNIPGAGAGAAVLKPGAKPETRAFAAAAQSSAVGASQATTRSASATVAVSGAASPSLPAEQGVRAKEGAGQPMNAAMTTKIEPETEAGPAAHLEIRSSVAGSIQSVPASLPSSVPSSVPAAVASPEFVLGAGLEPSQSWLGANKYVVGVLLVVAAAVAAVFLLR